MRVTPLLHFAFCLLFAFASAALAADDLDSLNARLDRSRGTLDDIGKALGSATLDDAALRQLRGRVEPIPSEMQEVIDRLTPHLQAIGARLQELGVSASDATKAQAEAQRAPAPPAQGQAQGQGQGQGQGQAPKPTDKTGAGKAAKPPVAPPAAAPPAVSPPAGADAAPAPEVASRIDVELAEQRKLYDTTEATIKRARAILVEARQTLVTIVAKERALFTRALFLRSGSLFSPVLWREALAEAIPALRAAQSFLSDRGSNVGRRIAGGPGALIALLALATLAAVWPSFLVARRVSTRDAATTPGELQKYAAAGWSALVVCVTPVAVAGALLAILDGFELMDNALEPVVMRLFEGVARIAAAYALTRAILAPSKPAWRLFDPGDAMASRLTAFFTASATILSMARLLEQIEETIQTGVAFVVLTRGVAALLVALLALACLAPARQRATTPPVHRKNKSATFVRVLLGIGAAIVLAALASGFIAFANFIIIEIGWTLVVGAVLMIVTGLVSNALEAALSPDAHFTHPLATGFGAKRDRLASTAVLLSGGLNLLLWILAIVAALAPLGLGSGVFLEDLRTAFFTVKIGDIVVSPATALAAIALFAVVISATHWLRDWLDTRYLPLTRLDLGLRNAIGTSLSYAGFILAASIALSHVGLGVEKLAIVAGALSVGIGFGLQSIVNNFVSGLILLWERAIRVGDWVVVGDEQGYVKRINVRSTEIETFDRATMIVPNSNLVAGVVKNWLRGDKVGRIKISLAPHCSADPELVRDVLLAAARAQDGVLRIPAPQVMFLGLDETTFKFELWCFVEDVEKATRLRSDLYFDLHTRLKEGGVRMAAPPAPAPAPPVLAPSPAIEKLAAAIASGGFALDQMLDTGKKEPQGSDRPEQDARAAEKTG